MVLCVCVGVQQPFDGHFEDKSTKWKHTCKTIEMEVQQTKHNTERGKNEAKIIL